MPKRKNADPPILYYNASIINRGTQDLGAGGDPYLRFSETRANPLINDISKYYFSIVRFSMSSGKNLPLFIPLIETEQADPNRTIYRATIDVSFDYDFGGAIGVKSFSYRANGGQAAPYDRNWIEWTPQSQGLSTPSPPTTSQSFIGEYYWAYTYDHFNNLLNDLLSNLHGEIQVAFAAFFTAEGGVGPAPSVPIAAPYFI